jgi:hypothetical protein
LSSPDAAGGLSIQKPPDENFLVQKLLPVVLE